MLKALRYVLSFMVGKAGIDFGLRQFFCLQREERLLEEKKTTKKLVRNDQQTLANF